MQESVEFALKRIEELEKKLENYYSILNVGNELDFILKGTHLLQKDIDDLLVGEFGEDILNSIETLKQELLAQKKVIEDKGGFVTVAKNYPSPSEITAGIRTVTGGDFSLTTATEADVMKGKTFYSGSSVLKTGTAEFDLNAMNHIFMCPENVQTSEEEVNYTFPDGVTKVRCYCFNKNINPLRLHFNDDIEIIEEYAFYGTSNIKFFNFENLSKLKNIKTYAFTSSTCDGIDFSRLPNNIETLTAFSFYALLNPTGLNVKFPDNIKTIGNGVFRQENRCNWNSLDLSNYPLTTLADYCFQKVAFDCDFVPSAKIKEVGDYFNYSGCFNNIIIPATITSLRPYCFGGQSGDAASLYYLKTVTFEGETPCTVGTNAFAQQYKANNFKIYVPDNSIEAYKAVGNLSSFADYIYPMSQKE